VDVPEIDVEALAKLHADGQVTLIDVRNPDEYEAGHVPGAQLIPLPELPQRLSEVPGGPLHVICAVGGRSRRACELLAAQGHDATNVAGGTKGWIEAGHPVTTGVAP
jgi:rhodanese-related sulfurtransferase